MCKTITEVLPDNLSDHWAVRAWNQLGTRRSEPDSIQILKRNAKSAVYRLGGLSSGGAAVVAKRCLTPTANVERIIYEQLLPRLGLPALRCYGFCREPAGEFSWLFLEEAAGAEYSSLCEPHRVLAGRWRAALDGAALECGRLPGLPDRDCGYYRQQLRRVEACIQELLTNPAVPREDLSMLRTLASQFEAVEAHWQDLEEWCSGFPRTIVHGDLVEKNVRVGSRPLSPALLVFDWEVAGWGVPATDLAQSIGRTVSPDLAAYRDAMAGYGFRRKVQAVQRMAECGRFFRVLDSMFWVSHVGRNDSFAYLSKPIACFRIYAARLAQFLSSIGTNRSPGKRPQKHTQSPEAVSQAGS